MCFDVKKNYAINFTCLTLFWSWFLEREKSYYLIFDFCTDLDGILYLLYLQPM